jgi:hypothetical protein
MEHIGRAGGNEDQAGTVGHGLVVDHAPGSKAGDQQFGSVSKVLGQKDLELWIRPPQSFHQVTGQMAYADNAH